MPYLELNVLNNAPETPILGIDLGTTNSLVAVFRDGRPEVVRTHPSDARIPSVIHFPLEGAPIVGRAAREYAYTDPGRTLFSVKRLMGRRLSEVAEDLKSVPFPASETGNGVLQLEIRGKQYTPQELSALILMRVHDLACQHLDANPDRAVITVPAYFDDAQRQATRDAARLAGLDVVRIINEPTAASLAYGLDQRNQGTIAVYDLGGGTFDVSILSIEDGVFRVLSTSGDTHLGGDDLDRALVEVALGELRDRVGEEADDPAFLRGLRLAAEKCKIELSSKPEADFHVVLPDQGITWHKTVTRAELERLIEPLLARTFDACRRALADADLKTDRIDEVVLVGGSTRVPAVRAQVEAFFGRPPHCELNPDEVVALGAAVQGHVLAGGTRDILLMDVTPLSLGLETMGGAVAKVIPRNAPIPCQHTEGFTTYADNQTGMDFHVVQGERELASDCRTLARFKLSGIPPMPAGMARILVRFQLDADGILRVTAKEESTGTRAEIEVQPMSGLTDAEVEAMLKASYDHAKEDFDASLLANLKTEMGTMIRASEAHLDDARAHLDKETVADLEEAIAAAKAARDAGADVKEVQKVRDALERATLPLAALLMDSVAKRALTGKSLDEV
jgi:Fe-S protein assembly chaperone HscA